MHKITYNIHQRGRAPTPSAGGEGRRLLLCSLIRSRRLGLLPSGPLSHPPRYPPAVEARSSPRTPPTPSPQLSARRSGIGTRTRTRRGPPPPSARRSSVARGRAPPRSRSPSRRASAPSSSLTLPGPSSSPTTPRQPSTPQPARTSRYPRPRRRCAVVSASAPSTPSPPSGIVLLVRRRRKRRAISHLFPLPRLRRAVRPLRAPQSARRHRRRSTIGEEV